MHQHVVLLRIKTAYHFLKKWHSDAAFEIQQEYMRSLKLFYAEQFEKYWQGLCGLEVFFFYYIRIFP